MRAGGSHDDPDGSHDRPSATGHGTAGLFMERDRRPLQLGPDHDMLYTGQMAALNRCRHRPMSCAATHPHTAAPEYVESESMYRRRA